MKVRKTLGVLSLFVLILVISSNAGKAATFEVNLSIQDAYYCDLDNDGVEDDIYGIAILTSSKEIRTYNILKYELIYPSGESYVNYFHHSVKDDIIVYEFYWINSVKGSGWYTFNLDVYILGKGYAHLYDSLVFDPPDGDPDEPPVTWVNSS